MKVNNISSTVNTTPRVTLAQAAALIAATPQVRFMLVGEPGIGKSSIIKVLQTTTGIGPDRTAYIDVPTLDLGDVALPAVDHTTKTTTYYPNARFRLHHNEPVLIMLDEFSKGADPVKGMLHPMLEPHNPRLGDLPIPDGSIIFLTGNLSTDGVSDSIKAHSLNRVTRIEVRKPTAEEWCAWAVDNSIDASVVAYVSRSPNVMMSYRDLNREQLDQPEYASIFNPYRPPTPCVTPRSLEKASHIVKAREHFDRESLLAALCGTIGETAARDLSAFIEYQNQLPTAKEIIEAPATTRLPSDPGAQAVLVYKIQDLIKDTTARPIMQYVMRMPAEWVATFCVSVAKSSKQSVMFRACPEFTTYLRENADLF